MNYPRIKLNYTDIKTTSFKSKEPTIYCINYEGVKYEYLINFIPNFDSLVVFGSGAYEPDKFDPPVFQRHAWMDEVRGSSIYFNDPTLYLGKMSLGWGYGTNERHYLKDIASILELILNKLEIEPSKTLFYGSSGGGFMSMLLASLLKGKALVNNPQTIVTSFYKSMVDNLKKGVLQENEELLPNRTNVIEFLKESKHFPEIHYIQNSASDFDMAYQVIPFIKSLKELETIFINKVTFDFYYDKKAGHNPLDKERSLKLINSKI